VAFNRVLEHVITYTRSALERSAPAFGGVSHSIRTELTVGAAQIMGSEVELRRRPHHSHFQCRGFHARWRALSPLRTRLLPRRQSRPDDVTRTGSWRSADPGIGIDGVDPAAAVLSPFYTTKGERGTGLGLAMGWHGQRPCADLYIDSAVGRGTTVRLRFGRLRIGPGTPSAAPSATSRSATADPAGHVIRMLITSLATSSSRIAIRHGG